MQLHKSKIDFDSAKRADTFLRRGLDVADAALVFAGEPLTVEDDWKDYREPRFITIGHLNGRMVLIAWTPRGDACRIVTNVIVQSEWAVVESLNRGTQTGTLQSSLGQFPPTGRYM